MNEKIKVNKKELYYDMNSNMYKLIDIEQNMTEKCGIYSDIIPKFKNYVTGFVSKREDTNFAYDSKISQMYRPTTCFYNGYFPFPRPKENIFKNITTENIKDKCQDKELNLANGKKNLKRSLKSAFTTTNFNKKVNDNLSIFSKTVYENKLHKEDGKYLKEYYNKHLKAKKQKLFDLEIANECRSIEKCLNKLKFSNKKDLNLKSPSKKIISKVQINQKYLKSDVNMKDYINLFHENEKSPSPKEIKMFNHTFTDFKKKNIALNEICTKSINNSELDLSNDSKNYNSDMNKTYKDFGHSKFSDKLVTNELHMLNKDKSEKYLKGYKDIPEKEKGIVNIKKNFHIKKETDYYISNKQLLMKTNPIAFKVFKTKEDLDLKYLKRKLEDQKVKSYNLFGKEITEK